jgi:hypothetical protein
MPSSSILAACSRTVYLCFCSSAHFVWLRCQTYFTTPSKIVWRISIGESCVGSNPGKCVSKCCGYQIWGDTFHIEDLISDGGHLFIYPVGKLILNLIQRFLSSCARDKSFPIQNCVCVSLMPVAVCSFVTFDLTPEHASLSSFSRPAAISSEFCGLPG